MEYDFSGWATRNDLKCSDGRTIRRNAFKDQDGLTVPLVWSHKHSGPGNVLGHALLENREEGVYTYGVFNDSEAGRNAKLLVQHGDVTALSIYANQLKQNGGDVLHGAIREVSLVLAGANPGAYIDNVIVHGDGEEGDAAIIYTGEEFYLAHSDGEEEEEEEKVADNSEGKTCKEVFDTLTEEQKTVVYAMIGQALQANEVSHSDEDDEDDDEGGDMDAATVKQIFETLNKNQKQAVYALVGMALENEKGGSVSHSDEGDGANAEGGDMDAATVKRIFETLSKDQKQAVYALVGMALENEKNGEGTSVKHNLFDNEYEAQNALSHSDEANILSLAKSNSVGSLRDAMEIYAANNGNEALMHAFDDDDLESLFPEYKDVKPGAPELIERDQGWVSTVMSKIHKSPISRIRTRQMDIRGTDLRAYGYQKGSEKVVPGNPKLLKRTTDPQTVYRKDALNRDDIIDITDFDVVAYQYGIMKQNLNEELAIAIMVGDGRDDGDDYKISEEHIRSIWHDDDLYTIHYDVDIDAAKTELQGTNTSATFGENYIYAEAIISAALYAREDFKGSGTPDFFCTPHLLNVMLLARDLNGRRIYDSKSDLAAALNVGAIYTAEQFADLTRTDSDGNTKELLGIFVNLADYYVGSTKGGEITKFNQFDIDFNQEKYLIETRLSGALTRVYSAIALEMPVTATEDEESA